MTSEKPTKKKTGSRKPDPELPDDDAIRRLFPKRVVDRVNREVGHEPASKGGKKGPGKSE